ncbi:MAG: PQQ-dependent sugar dehydrogenase [Planctomycetota bacterium]
MRDRPAPAQVVATAAAAVLTAVPAAYSQPLEAIDAEFFVTPRSTPLHVFADPARPDEVYIVQQAGLIDAHDRVSGAFIRNVLDIRTRVIASGEQGLIGAALHPAGDRLAVHYTRPDLETAPPNDSFTRVSVFPYDSATGDADESDGMEDVVIEIDQPFTNHNAGWIGFGPLDGYLYIPTGDGGSGADPGDRAQNPNNLLGKVLRLDIESDAFPPADDFQNYAIPEDNPFVGTTDGLEEIWSLGLRNPYRADFDRLTGGFFMVDVGQDTREEVNYEPPNSPGEVNYGWRCREGLLPFISSAFGCDTDDFTDPVFDVDQDTGACSIAGVAVYRGDRLNGFDGRYFFGDLCASDIWSVGINPDGSADVVNHTDELRPAVAGGVISGGTDAHGDVYIGTFVGIYRIIRDDGRCNPADLAEPLGVLSQLDVDAFVTSFFAGEADAAALANPFDLVSQLDVVEFVRLFFAGCPAN